MNNIEFLEYIPATMETQKYLAMVKIAYKGLNLRFKVCMNSKTNGLFLATGAILVKDPMTQEEKYKEAFEIDSKAESDRIYAFVMGIYYEKTRTQSVFNSPIPFASVNSLPANANYPPVDQNRMGGTVIHETQEKLPF